MVFGCSRLRKLQKSSLMKKLSAITSSKMDSTLIPGLTRRQFLQTTALATAGATLASPSFLRAEAGNKLNIAVVGPGGRGADDTAAVASENIVALCEVDESRVARLMKRFPKATFHKDFRQMLEKQKDIDAVIVATPDHLHAVVSVMAMKMGKHVYCEKPLTYSVDEARLLRQLAKETKVATQMGNQGSAGNGLRRAVELIQDGVIGPVHELHVWSNRPIWPQGIDRPQGEDPVPPNLDWNLWLGPAPVRPFKQGVYHPFNWRGWLDFGTGAIGDMACHTINLPFRGLKLGYPDIVECEAHSGLNTETFPKSSRIRFEFPARDGMPALKFWWYDGGWKPQPDLTKEIVEAQEQLPRSGCLLIGEKGRLFSPDDYGSQFFLMPEKNFQDVIDQERKNRQAPHRLAVSPGHHLEWINACKNIGPAPYSNFDIAAYLTEIILLGCVAMRAGKKLEWDGPNMKAKNAPEASQFLKRPYRQGWSL
jgi:predicted dehydrogenase